MHTLSVTIITKNEEDVIRDCLESVKWADEIVVLDSGSTDATVAICREYTDKVFSTDWPGFGCQKNRALGRATSDWVLSIDADERVSDGLREQIEAVLQHSGEMIAYRVLRSNNYLGKRLRFTSGWVNEKILRLIKKGCGKFSDDLVHEKLEAQGPVGLLKGQLWHYSYHSLDDVLSKINLYSTASAETYFARGKRCGMGKVLTASIWAFIRLYFLGRGFLDGKEGLTIAISSFESVYYKYLKLMYMSRQSQL
ncbi:MAG: glycosyltransferase family 2 protein [Gammaproteobacteria bacterium]|nr:glycosyltransferase family 2 protein [Gammaproteobacteria bacterium]